jgi:hypothetical protein
MVGLVQLEKEMWMNNPLLRTQRFNLYYLILSTAPARRYYDAIVNSFEVEKHITSLIVKLLHDTKTCSAAADACKRKPVVEADLLIGSRAIFS